jgi:5'-methylthioadenosine phosphorylase
MGLKIGLILGTGMKDLFDDYEELQAGSDRFQTNISSQDDSFVDTPWGQAHWQHIVLGDNQFFVFNRHNSNIYGDQEMFSLPHQLDPRIIMYALSQELGVDFVIGSSAVGGVSSGLLPIQVGSLITPHDFVSFIGSSATFASEEFVHSTAFHRLPRFCDHLRHLLYDNGHSRVWSGGVVANFTGGPRYETGAEVTMLKSMGADLFSMNTFIPEVELATELSLHYLPICLVTNMALSEHDAEGDDIGKQASGNRLKLLGVIMSMVQKLTGSKKWNCLCQEQKSVFEICGQAALETLES